MIGYRDHVNLPLMPPIEPMLARLTRTIPRGSAWHYEPKWDGFRCVAFRDRANVYLQSRRGRPLGRYFPELTEAVAGLSALPFVIDGEIVVTGADGFDFVALLNRLHPAASLVATLSSTTPATFVAFDLLAKDDTDLLGEPFAERRRLLEEVLENAPKPIYLTPATNDFERARDWFDRFSGAGIDGIVVKDVRAPYEPGKRSMVKVKHDYTADCVVGGFRWHYDEATVGSLLLGLYEDETLRHIGLASSFTRGIRAQLLDEISPFVTTLEGHPWEHGFATEPPGAVARLPGTASSWGEGGVPNWVPLRPEQVVEVAYDHLDRRRFRHGARFKRWRTDRDPRSCTFEQFERARPDEFYDLFSWVRNG